MERIFGFSKWKTTSSQSQSGGVSGRQDDSSSSVEASKPEPAPTSPGECNLDEITSDDSSEITSDDSSEISSSAPTPPPPSPRISRQERRRRERELKKMIRKRESLGPCVC